MKQRTLGMLVALLLALASSAAQAGVMTNGPPTYGEADPSDRDFGSGGRQIADDFLVDAAGFTITNIEWWGVYSLNGSPTDSFTIHLFNNVPVSKDWFNEPAYTPYPPTVLSLGTVTRSPDLDPNPPNLQKVIPPFGLKVYHYSVSVTPVTLTAGRYWLSIFNNTTGFADDWYWATTYHSNDPIDSGRAFAADMSNFLPAPMVTPWQPQKDDYAFRFNSDPQINTPEPSSLVLFSLASIAFGGFARRRGQRPL
jgi:hypothetical protein